MVPPKFSEEQFEIHDHFSEILDALQPNKVDPAPSRWMVLGVLNFTMNNGKTLGIFLFDHGEGVPFKIGETYYRGGSRKALNEAMAAVSPK